MLIRNNNFFVKLIDLFVMVVFFIPVFFQKTQGLRDGKVKKILIMELWGIGDLVRMSAVLSPLKKRYPEAKIVLLSRDYGRDLFEDDARVEACVLFRFHWTQFEGKYNVFKWDWEAIKAVVRRLRQERFDIIFDARGDLRNNCLSFLIGAKKRIGYSWLGGSYFLTDDLTSFFKAKHRVDAWVFLLSVCGIEIEKAEPSLVVSQENKRWAQKLLKKYSLKGDNDLVGFHPGAAMKTRCWPMDRFSAVADFVREKYRLKDCVFV